MTENKLNNIYSAILVFSVLGAVLLGYSLLLYVSVHDYAGVPINELAEDMESQGIFASEYVTGIEEILTFTEQFPTWLDRFFLFFLGLFSVGILSASYRIKRVGYMTTFSNIVFVSLIILFLLTYYLEVAVWIKDLLFSAIPTVAVEIPIFNWYVANAGIYNMTLIFLAILLNFLDFDFSKFESRKDKELVNDEI